jgi:hypothetical protein
VTPQQIYDKHRGPSDPPWEALPAIARRGWAVAAAEASKNAPEHVSAPAWRPPTSPSVPDHARPRRPGAPRA